MIELINNIITWLEKLHFSFWQILIIFIIIIFKENIMNIFNRINKLTFKDFEILLSQKNKDEINFKEKIITDLDKIKSSPTIKKLINEKKSSLIKGTQLTNSLPNDKKDKTIEVNSTLADLNNLYELIEKDLSYKSDIKELEKKAPFFFKQLKDNIMNTHKKIQITILMKEYFIVLSVLTSLKNKNVLDFLIKTISIKHAQSEIIIKDDNFINELKI